MMKVNVYQHKTSQIKFDYIIQRLSNHSFRIKPSRLVKMYRNLAQ